jgi:hypothetical protein
MAIGTPNNTIKTRIQLKSDTEANWKKAVLVADGGTKISGTSFVPLLGEIIIYTPDNTYDYSRLKIGDGSTNVVRLPFIDAGTVNGDTIVNEIVTFNEAFPSNGDSSKLYVNTTTKTIYYYNGTNYVKLSNYTYTFTRAPVSTISRWDTGRQPTFSLSGGTFSISTGTEPTLSYLNENFVRSVTKEGES